MNLEKGNGTCEIGNAMTILHTLGIRLTPTRTAMPSKEDGEADVAVGKTCGEFHFQVTGVGLTAQGIGQIVRETRKALGITQAELAQTAGTGTRLILNLEKGNDTCEIGKAMIILRTLGIRLTVTTPAIPAKEG
jgi:y4mF family transcriptional regulator